ncbi:GTA-gp10 family protein [Methylocystis sp. JR02]|uniref:GTA-gp10 family protein n=1 Tax=Methylocystis sp. JR02 TaxID=3046284 RepID=UPI0024BBDD8A|nr:GTA-gp10 family protein [Methylocystis sp. JR02]MDJ0449247.1 hypothetical protein [Methylocystis sp. JR02]
MANSARGVVAAQIGDETLELSLGLGALAEIEDTFGVDSFEDALNFGERVSAKKLRAFLAALLKGNEIELTPERTKALARMTPGQFMTIMVALMEASGLKQADATPAAQKEGAAAPFEAASAGERG